MSLIHYTVQYAVPRSTHWVTAGTHDRLADARRRQALLLSDERERGSGIRLRIVKHTGRVLGRAVK